MAKRLVACCDGTWNLADQPSKTNVTKLALSVLPVHAGTEQRVYYQSGVGTHGWDRLPGGAFGWGLSGNVLAAYRFLVETYEPGDQLYLFGYSRGAFTARSLAGLIRNCGILRRDSASRIKDAWRLYRNRLEEPAGTTSALFRRTYAHETRIRCIGVWDTVGSLGIPVTWRLPLISLFNRRWAFHDTELSSWVDGAFQAIAIDERRRPFEPALWHQQSGADAAQELKQVWFAGTHGDIGGGNKDTGLSDITLLWMVEQARRCGLEFDAAMLNDIGPATMHPRTGTAFRVCPSITGALHNTWTGLYRLTTPLVRPIGQAKDEDDKLDGCEYLADTAEKRRAHDPHYRPANLEHYLTHATPVQREPIVLPSQHCRPPAIP
ncbi:DUF2235 domain-containing protein [Streptomyces spinosirectus]